MLPSGSYVYLCSTYYSYALSVESSYRLRNRRTYSVYPRAYWRSPSCNAGWHLLPILRFRLYGYSRVMIAPNGAFFFLFNSRTDGRMDGRTVHLHPSGCFTFVCYLIIIYDLSCLFLC